MKYTLRAHPLVAKDFDEAYVWYEEKKADLGEQFLLAVRQKIQEIELHPETYSSKGRLGYREALVEGFPFIVVYKINKRKKEIYISSVHHAKKHPRNKYR